MKQSTKEVLLCALGIELKPFMMAMPRGDFLDFVATLTNYATVSDTCEAHQIPGGKGLMGKLSALADHLDQ